jgi:hypothetical protein
VRAGRCREAWLLEYLHRVAEGPRTRTFRPDGAGATPGQRVLATSPWVDALAARRWDGSPAAPDEE